MREKVHFAHIAASRRAPLAGKGSFPPYRCTRKISCKDTGETHANLQRNGGNGRKTACRSGQKTLISPTSLHEISQMQGYGGNARKRVRPAPEQGQHVCDGARKVRFLSRPLLPRESLLAGFSLLDTFPRHAGKGIQEGKPSKRKHPLSGTKGSIPFVPFVLTRTKISPLKKLE